MARYSPPRSWFYLKKRQSMGMGLGENGYPGRIRPDDSLGGGANMPGTGGGASSFAPRPAPSGYRWEFVTSQGVRVTSQNEPVVALVRAA